MKTALLTGATSGIGQAGAIALAEQGYALTLVARSRDKAAATRKRILAKTPEAQINWLFGDLSSLQDVRAIAQAFLATEQTLDLLWLNAGLCHNKRAISKDGYELMLAVNHLAPFLLTGMLFETLCMGKGEMRVVVTASGAYKAVDKLNLNDMNYESGFKTFEAYGNSKLCNILFTQQLAEKLQQAAPQKRFAVNCFHPGFVGTGIGTQVWLGKILMAGFRPFVRSSAKGAETGLFLATDPSVSGQSGGYYYDRKLQTLPPFARDTAAAKALWERSLQMTKP